jgi:hypothetical protein
MTIDALFLLKALFSISIVVGLSLIAERAGPRVAGLLTGLPLGAGIVIIFTGIEQGAVFSTQAAQHMVPPYSRRCWRPISVMPEPPFWSARSSCRCGSQL